MRILAAALASVVCVFGQAMPGTDALRLDGDPAAAMLAGMERYLDREIEASVARRPAMPDRERFKRIIGLVDRRIEFEWPRGDRSLEAGPEPGVLPVLFAPSRAKFPRTQALLTSKRRFPGRGLERALSRITVADNRDSL